MRIVLVAQTYGPINGPGLFTATLARGLAAAGDHVLVITPGDSLRSTLRADGCVAVARVRAWPLLRVYRDTPVPLVPAPIVRRVLEQVQPDLVHLQDHLTISRSAARVCAATGVPMLATNHFVPEHMLQVPVLSQFARGRRALERLAWRMVARVFERAKVIVAPTERSAAMLRRYVRSAPVRAISCGVDLSLFGSCWARSVLRGSLGLGCGERWFIYVGPLDSENQVQVLLRAFAAVVDLRVKLLVVGQGPQSAALRRLVRRLGLEQRVLFAGVVSAAELPRLLVYCDYFALGGDVERESIATLQAMAAGLPVLAARGALPELIEDGVNAALFAPRDADAAAERIRELISTPRAMACDVPSQPRPRRALRFAAYRADVPRALRRDHLAAPARGTRDRGLPP